MAIIRLRITRNSSRDENIRTSRDVYRPIKHKMDHTQGNLIQLKTFELELDFAGLSKFAGFGDLEFGEMGHKHQLSTRYA